MYQKVPRRESLLKLHSPDFGTPEEQAVLEVLRSGWLTRGPRVERFEQEFARKVDAPHSLGTSSCTVALHLALRCCGVGPGDEVIVPALTFAATANTVVHCGARPVFADVEQGSLCMDPGSVEALVNERTKVIVPVHYAGIPCDLTRIHAIAMQHGLDVVEDCAHAVEAVHAGNPVGVASGSRFAAYSFYATKNLICGEGGMLCCRDEADRRMAARLSLHGLDSNAWERHHNPGRLGYDLLDAGYKYNMQEIQAALGLVQLAKLDSNQSSRSALCRMYVERLSGHAGLSIPVAKNGDSSANHLFVVRIPASEEDEREGTAQFRNRVLARLREENIEASVHYPVLTETTFYMEHYGTCAADAPVASSASQAVLSLPLYPTMTEADVDYCCSKLLEILDEGQPSQA